MAGVHALARRPGRERLAEQVAEALAAAWRRMISRIPEDMLVLGKVPMKKSGLLDELKRELAKRGVRLDDLTLFNVLRELYDGRSAGARRRLMAKYPELRDYVFEPGPSWRHEWYVSLGRPLAYARGSASPVLRRVYVWLNEDNSIGSGKQLPKGAKRYAEILLAKRPVRLIVRLVAPEGREEIETVLRPKDVERFVDEVLQKAWRLFQKGSPYGGELAMRVCWHVKNIASSYPPTDEYLRELAKIFRREYSCMTILGDRTPPIRVDRIAPELNRRFGLDWSVEDHAVYIRDVLRKRYFNDVFFEEESLTSLASCGKLSPYFVRISTRLFHEAGREEGPRASRAPEDVGLDEYLRAIVKAYREYLREHGLLDWYLRQDDRAGYPVPLTKLIRRIEDPRIRALPLEKHAELCRRLSRRDVQSRFQYSYFPLAEDEENKHLVSIRPSLVKKIGESEEEGEEETPEAEAVAAAPGSQPAAPRRRVYVWLGEDGIVHTGKSRPRNVKQYVVVERTAKGVAVEVAIPGIRARLRLDDPARIKEFEDAVYNVVGQLVGWTAAHAVLGSLAIWPRRGDKR